LTKNVLYHEDD